MKSGLLAIVGSDMVLGASLMASTTCASIRQNSEKEG